MSDLPAVGVGLPVGGPHTSPDAIECLAVAAEHLGFSSISLSERLLLPAGPTWTNDFGLPDWPFYDPLETLAWLAAKTERITLRADVLIPLFQQPVVLARRLATIDHLSGGRLVAGCGLGWLPEEFEATGVPLHDRAVRFEDALAAMRACWAPDPVEHDGSPTGSPARRSAPSRCKARSRSPSAPWRRQRSCEQPGSATGFTIGFRNWADTTSQLEAYRAAGGTGPVSVRCGPMLADAEHATPPTTWTEGQFLDDLHRAAELGIDELLWDLNIVGYAPDRQIELFTQLADTLWG